MIRNYRQLERPAALDKRAVERFDQLGVALDLWTQNFVASYVIMLERIERRRVNECAIDSPLPEEILRDAEVFSLWEPPVRNVVATAVPRLL